MERLRISTREAYFNYLTGALSEQELLEIVERDAVMSERASSRVRSYTISLPNMRVTTNRMVVKSPIDGLPETLTVTTIVSRTEDTKNKPEK